MCTLIIFSGNSYKQISFWGQNQSALSGEFQILLKISNMINKN